MSDAFLKEHYYNVNYGFSGAAVFFKTIKPLIPENLKITLQDVKDFISKQETAQLHKAVKKNVNFRKITSPPYHFQVDILDLANLKYTPPKGQRYKTEALPRMKYNQRYWLIIIDILSRKAFVYYLPNRTQQEIVKAYNQFLEDLKPIVPKGIEGDAGFNIKSFVKILDESNTSHAFSTAKDDHITAGDRLGIVDRFIRTLRGRLNKFSTAYKTKNISTALPGLVEAYNNQVHSSTNESPKKLFIDIPNLVEKQYDDMEYNEKVDNTEVLSVGDSVRKVHAKGTFKKGGFNYSSELYKIEKILNGKVTLVDAKGTVLKRKFKSNELMKVDKVETKPDVLPQTKYEVEKFLEKKARGSLYLVKWKGIDEKSWETRKSLIKDLKPKRFNELLKETEIATQLPSP